MQYSWYLITEIKTVHAPFTARGPHLQCFSLWGLFGRTRILHIVVLYLDKSNIQHNTQRIPGDTISFVF